MVFPFGGHFWKGRIMHFLTLINAIQYKVLMHFIFQDKRTLVPGNRFGFLNKELLVRLANIMKEIDHLPDQLKSMPSVQLVKTW